MASRDKAIRDLAKSLGGQYEICTIDLEPVIYRDVGNGFNVEVSGVYTAGPKKKATIYLWHGDRQPECIIVKTVRDVSREEISKTVDELYDYSNSLLAQGFDTRDKIFHHKFKIWNKAKGGSNMRLKVFYGSENTVSSNDKDYFSRGKYECKALMKSKTGQPVAISQSKDEEFPIWKVEYGFSCLVFPSYDEAMDYCEGRFLKVD